MSQLEELGIKFDIDPLRLDDAWVAHSQMVYNIGVLVADLQLEHDKAKSNLEMVSADLDMQIRANPTDFGIGKLTETSLSSVLVIQPEYRLATTKVSEARHALGLAQAASNALEHKKRALTMMVDLWTNEYYSEPHENDKKDIRSRGRRRLEQKEEDVEV